MQQVGKMWGWGRLVTSTPHHAPKLHGDSSKQGGGVEVHSFSQFSALSQFSAIPHNFSQFPTISRNFSTIAFGLSTLRACWCPLPLRTTVAEQYASMFSCPQIMLQFHGDIEGRLSS